MIEAEALQVIQQTAQKAAEPKVVKLEGEDQLVWLAHNGKVDQHELPPRPRNHVVDSLEDLVAAVEHFQASSIWVSDKQVVAILDAERRRDRITWKLEYTEPFKCLLACGDEAMALSQRDLVRWLKINLWRCVEDETLIPAVSNLEWKRREEGHGQIDHGRQSVGRSIEAEVASRTAKIPETFSVNVRVHANRGEEFAERIVLSLEPDVARQVFLVQALPEEVKLAIERRGQSILDRIQESKSLEIPVFFGEP